MHNGLFVKSALCFCFQDHEINVEMDFLLWLPLVLRSNWLGFVKTHAPTHLFLYLFVWILASALNERQRAILEEFAEEEINNENNTSAEENW